MLYYWSYGSNLNVAQMHRRCPGAVKVGPLVLDGASLRFRGVADVVHRHGEQCQGGLWRITDACEDALDTYEGVDTGLYEKLYFTVSVGGGSAEDCLYYKMCERGFMPPTEGYLRGIAEGYGDFGLDLGYLDRAVEHSWNRKDKTPYLRWRHARAGRPALARSVA